MSLTNDDTDILYDFCRYA